MRKLLFILFLFAFAAGADEVVEIDIRDAASIQDLLNRTIDPQQQDRSERAIIIISEQERADLTRANIGFKSLGTFAVEDNQPEGSGTIPGFSCYRTVAQTYADLAALAAANPDLASWDDIGDSWEKINGPGLGYDIMALTIANNPGIDSRPPFVVVAAMHARELTTAETVTRFAEHMINGYGVDPDITWILDHHRIHIVPQYNPDGREDVEDGQLSRRKNTNTNFCGAGNYGIDLNRNSTFFFGGPNASTSVCSDIFRGPTAASEPETQAIESALAAWFVDQRGPGVMDAAPATTEGVFISMHSFGNIVLYPWEDDPFLAAPNQIELRTLSRKFGFFTDYDACQDCLGGASGTIVDEAYGEYGVAAYTFEIGSTFSESCSNFENSIYPVNLPALVYAAKSARRPYQNPAGPDVLDVDLAETRGPSDLVTLTAIADDTRYDSNGHGNEPTQPIASVRYSIDQPPWTVQSTAMTPVDGVFDSAVEAATAMIDTSQLSLGEHLVYVFAQDTDGNVGPPTAIWLTVDDILFESGFE